jgi:hypothetical protein
MAASLLTGCSSPPATTGTQSHETFHSAVMEDDYVLRYRLPPGYDADPTARFPVVYQLDPTFVGLKEMAFTTGLLSRHEAEGTVPPCIVVGIDYPDPYTRFRDYASPETLDPAYGSDGADRFYRVIRDEIVPHVDATLRTDPGQRYLVGHSMGGFMALYAAFRHDPAAPLLAGVVASDPSYDQNLFTYEQWHLDRSAALPMRLYLAYATYNGPLQEMAHRWMTERLTGRGYTGLDLLAEAFETDHGGIIEPSFDRGLAFVVGGVR